MSKPGGDTVQWHMYDKVATDAGFQTVTWFESGPTPVADLYHGFNIDRPLELYPRLRKVRAMGKPYVLSTIHHPHAWVERFRRAHPPGGLCGKLLYRSPLGYSTPAVESLKEWVRLIRTWRTKEAVDLHPTWSKRVMWLLRNAATLTLLAPVEADYLATDFGFKDPRTDVMTLPNWVMGTGAPQGSPPIEFADLATPPVIVVGRVEARKNVLGLCRLAEAAERTLVVVGRPNPNEAGYAAELSSTLATSRFVRWIPGVARERMGSIYGHASHLLNGSFVEVSPLVDVEALSHGCPVVTTRYALHHALLPRGTPVCDPYEDDDVIRHLKWRPVRIPAVQAVDPDECTSRLTSLYHRLAGTGVTV